MLQLETTNNREGAADCADFILRGVGKRVASKHQKAPFVTKYMARWTAPKYLRGSDLSERLGTSFEVLKRSGYNHKEALVFVAERAKEFLGKIKAWQAEAWKSRTGFHLHDGIGPKHGERLCSTNARVRGRSALLGWANSFGVERLA